ncbi:hypothetical protein CBR_g37173 [Chara braunii]|uniref:Uncharacterized protein n=1 Tax=Chara braunii TaxID=69332 RepID=A0A388LMH0_CHABU|nr:hypothetical protein CBR_g37173 [Chara braunii]|eukprot:GBG83461.1 hypothetical protein CBR_g37173 [Chara braunii]
MLDSRARLEVEPVRTGMRKGMTQEEIAQHEPRKGGEDDSYSEAARDSRVVHSTTSCSESCTPIACPATSVGHNNGGDGGVGILLASTQTSVEIYGGPPAEVTITFPGGLAGGGWSLCDPDGQGGPARAEEVTAAAAVEGEVAASEEEVPAMAMGEEEVPAAATAEGEIAAAVEREKEVQAVATEEEEVRTATIVEGKEEAAPTAVVPDVYMKHDGADAIEDSDDAEEHLMQQFIMEELDPVVGGFTSGMAKGLGMSPPTGWQISEMGPHFDFNMSMGAPPSCGGSTSTDWAPSRDGAAGEMGTQTQRERTIGESPDTARCAETRGGVTYCSLKQEPTSSVMRCAHVKGPQRPAWH